MLDIISSSRGSTTCSTSTSSPGSNSNTVVIVVAVFYFPSATTVQYYSCRVLGSLRTGPILAALVCPAAPWTTFPAYIQCSKIFTILNYY